MEGYIPAVSHFPSQFVKKMQKKATYSELGHVTWPILCETHNSGIVQFRFDSRFEHDWICINLRFEW